MIPPLTHSLPDLLGGFALASMISGFIYFVFRWPTGKAQVAIVACASLFTALACIFPSILRTPFNLTIAVWTVAVSFIHCAIENAREKRAKKWIWQFWISLQTIATTFIVGPLVLGNNLLRPAIRTLFMANSFWAVWGFIGGLIIAPISFSFFRAILPTLRLRPGIDKHLE